MRISLRILLGYFVIVGVAAGFVLSVFQQEVKPGVRQALEDSLVDSANLLAELAAPELAAGTLGDGRIAAALAGYRARPIDVQIWDHRKRSPDLRVYVTDRAGIVVFDSAGTALGQDYSRWNDVYLTLQGRYGARSSPASAGDPEDTLMHVAAPVEDPSGAIIGVLTVVRANRTVAPIVARSERRIRLAGYTLVGLSLVLGVLFTGRLTRSIHRLRDYARAVADGAVVSAPASAATELAQLGQALETMRRKIDGRQYVEEYVHALTHELKSPLAAIRGAAELLREDLPPARRERFLDNLLDQCGRLQGIADKLLDLARVEQRRQLEAPQRIELGVLAGECLEAVHPRLEAAGLELRSQLDAEAVVRGEPFLLGRAISNLLDNAIDFSPPGGVLEVAVGRAAGRIVASIRDRGPGVPEYARDRVFERFYSLPRPEGRGRSTGLGLAFVAEVARLHGGSATLTGRPGGGSEARLELPAAR